MDLPFEFFILLNTLDIPLFHFILLSQTLSMNWWVMLQCLPTKILPTFLIWLVSPHLEHL